MLVVVQDPVGIRRPGGKEAEVAEAVELGAELDDLAVERLRVDPLSADHLHRPRLHVPALVAREDGHLALVHG